MYYGEKSNLSQIFKKLFWSNFLFCTLFCEKYYKANQNYVQSDSNGFRLIQNWLFVIGKLLIEQWQHRKIEIFDKNE